MEPRDNGSAAISGNVSGAYDSVEGGWCELFNNTDTPDYYTVYCLWVYVGSIIMTCGCAGHTVTIVSILASRQMRRQTMAPYLLVMSLSGLLALFTGLMPHIVLYHTCDRVALGDATSEFGCRFLVLARYFALHLYSWTEALISVERLVAVRWPLRGKRWLSRKASVGIVAGAAAVLLPLEVVPFLSYGYDNSQFCNVVDTPMFKAWKYAHLTLYCLLPVVVMLPCNALTLSAMRKSEFDSANLRKAKPITIMMMSLNCLFLVSATPIMVVEYTNSESEVYATAEIIWCACRLVLYAGSASTIFVYVIMAARFRKTLADLVARGRDRIKGALSLQSLKSLSVQNAPVKKTVRSLSLPQAPASNCATDHRVKKKDEWNTIAYILDDRYLATSGALGRIAVGSAL